MPVKQSSDRLASAEFGVEALSGNERCGTEVGGLVGERRELSDGVKRGK